MLEKELVRRILTRTMLKVTVFLDDIADYDGMNSGAVLE
jgi:hypothetical protein